MQPDKRFRERDKAFWANVRTISEKCRYTKRGTGQVKVPSIRDMVSAMASLNLDTGHVYDAVTESPAAMGRALHEYFEYRADVLNGYVEPRLMDVSRAAATYDRLSASIHSPLPVSMNKQTGDKRAPAYLTGIVNLLIHNGLSGLPCNYSPPALTTFTTGRAPLRTLARRMDGCFPSVVNPIAIWEIKEYYHTTTFGSRVAGGVYETLLDGLELEELREHEGVDCQHLLVVDAYSTWWTKGRSFLCRMIDMLHMGYVDEVLFGYEVVERMPDIVRGWAEEYRRRLGGSAGVTERR